MSNANLIVDKIFKEISTYDTNDSSLHSGIAGILLFAHEYYLYKQDEQSTKTYISLVDRLCSTLTVNYSTTYSSGLAGIGCVLRFLSEHGSIPFSTNKLFQDIDDVLKHAIKKFIEINELDFFHGLVGLGNYFTERKNAEVLEYILDELERMAIKDANGYRWVSSIEVTEGVFKPVCQISLSHGNAAVLIFLCKCYQVDVKLRVKARLLINEVTKYILSTKRKGKLSAFPPYGDYAGTDFANKDSRIAWCNGDVGIAVALLQAADFLNDMQLKSEAINTLKLAMQRKKPEDSMIIDTSLCHGTAGITCMYDRAFEITRLKEFSDTAKYWHNITINKFKNNNVLESYRAWGGENEGWIIEHNFLTGISGIALSLLSQINPHKTRWEKFMLLHI